MKLSDLAIIFLIRFDNSYCIFSILSVYRPGKTSVLECCSLIFSLSSLGQISLEKSLACFYINSCLMRNTFKCTSSIKQHIKHIDCHCYIIVTMVVEECVTYLLVNTFQNKLECLISVGIQRP